MAGYALKNGNDSNLRISTPSVKPEEPAGAHLGVLDGIDYLGCNEPGVRTVHQLIELIHKHSDRV